MSAAFLVDGHLEKRVVQRLCGDAPVRITNLNGKSVTLLAIANKLASLIRLLKGRYYPVVIIVDREQRVELSSNIENELENLLVEKGIDRSSFVISCADRMIENWIVAGTTKLMDEDIDIAEELQCIDGLHGKSIVKSFLAERKMPYGETTTGVDMFCSMDFALAASRSPSYARLHSKLETYCPKLRSTW